MSWQHVRALIFDAGNEYRKFEFLDTDHPTMGIDAIDWDGSDYQVKVMTDSPRPNYVYDEAAKGSFYIRNSDNVENNNTCEYAQIHFTLKAPKTARRCLSERRLDLRPFPPRISDGI